MNKKKPKTKRIPREFFILETETGCGWEVRRYYQSFHKTRKLAEALKKYLDLKDPYDKREIIHVKEVLK